MSIKRNSVFLNSEAQRPAWDSFREHLNAVTSREGWRPYEAIGYWLDASFRSMRGATLSGEARAKNEAEYMRIVKRCRAPSESMTDLSSMLGSLVCALETAPVDFIGPIFGEYAASSSLGQFFTPYHVSKMMAEMTIGERDAMLADLERPYITLQEPACGVGGMMLATCEVLRDRGFDLARQVHWQFIDVDYSAICAAYLQVNLVGVSGVGIHGNTISLQTWMATPTLAAILYPKRFDVAETEPAQTLAAPIVVSAKPRKSVSMQLSLFDEAAE